ncbi:unnamed protein product [Ceutorhynchus assimilis]|uniref:Farnesol dehydrogenase-like n=1 Tax=Ceutorhynchus assimilis TaxID=467358 RepID=A0A9N9MWS0_9CUCU|nr:unnamed protein product [Ceutorhynchus assimilis]
MNLSLERFVGKVAVVTGASAGIGAAIVEDLVKNGVIVAGLARRVDRIVDQAEQLKDEPGKLYGFKCDLTVEEDIKSAFRKIIRKLGDIHVLVNNAGLMLSTDLINGDTEKWKTMLDTNVLALCIATREALQNMISKGTKGHIIHINSITGHQILDIPRLSVYGASKFAVTGLAETLCNDLNREKIPVKVTSISPGYVKTEFCSVAEIPDEFLEQLTALHSNDISAAVIYALSTPPHVNVTEITVKPLGSSL